MWGFTGASAKRLFAEVFGQDSVEIALYGNVFAATAFLYGLPYQELRPEELNYLDADFQVIIGVRAIKPAYPSP
jgi:hypothetical protein